jgi:hypothetical protein
MVGSNVGSGLGRGSQTPYPYDAYPPKERIKDRIQAWEDSPVTNFLLPGNDINTMRLMAELIGT